MRDALGTALIGFALGFALSRIGFSSWDEVHGMFVFSDLRLFLTFVCGVSLLMASWVVIHRSTGATWPPRAIHRGTLPGGVLFGVGWALSGACPSIVFVQLGEGQLGALVTLLGIVTGNAAYGYAQQRWLHWPTQSCADV